MTNIFAVQVDNKDNQYIFCVADSQTSFSDRGTKNSNNQKLVQCGHNLIMATGARSIAMHVYDKLEKTSLPAKECCEKILEITEEYAKKYAKDEKMGTEFIVSGLDKGKLCVYGVNILNTKRTRRDYNRIHGIQGSGSGSRHVGPAVTEDMEKGFLTMPKDPLQAMMLCYAAGVKAERDLGVNEKLQLGFISPTAVRMIMPHAINPVSDEARKRYWKNLTGIDITITKDKAGNDIDYAPVGESCKDFYDALMYEMNKLFVADIECNLMHTKFKSWDAKFEDYQKTIDKRRNVEAGVRFYVDTFMKGGLDNIVTAVDRYLTTRQSYLRKTREINNAINEEIVRNNMINCL